MQRVDFFGLDRPIQERFVASARGAAPPLPLAVERPPLPRSVMVCVATAALCLIGIGVVAKVGYGKLDSELGLQPTSLLGVYVGLGAVAGIALAAAWRVQRARALWPFPPGVYAFPSAVVDARSLSMQVHPLRELVDVNASGRKLNLAFSDGARFQFVALDAARAAELSRSVAELRQRFSPDLAPVSSRELSVLDPLADNGFANPFSPRERMQMPKAGASWLVLPLAAVLLAALGAGVWAVRNRFGESALYAAARKADTRAAYQAYVARGGKNPDVPRVLLPRAELAEVVAKNSNR
ncbi:MAG: hypothetical protein QM756_40875 [Polyangiaceae bacterium]